MPWSLLLRTDFNPASIVCILSNRTTMKMLLASWKARTLERESRYGDDTVTVDNSNRFGAYDRHRLAWTTKGLHVQTCNTPLLRSTSF